MAASALLAGWSSDGWLMPSLLRSCQSNSCANSGESASTR
jgi:hypothetical protein